MKKYWQVAKNTWAEILTYRFNFAVWRFRNMLQLITAYYLWITVTPQNGEIFGYTQASILTYTLLASLVNSVVMSTRTQEIGENITSGDLLVFLIRPIRYFGYWFARDIGDKAMNIVFAVGEVAIVYFLLKPPIIIQQDINYILLAVFAVLLAVCLYFVIGCILGLIGFWSPETWAPRFILFILISFFSGSFIPLDIFPEPLYKLFQILPFSYLLYFPVKIYLGQLPYQTIFIGLCISGMWILISSLLLRLVWTRGLKAYSAQGR